MGLFGKQEPAPTLAEFEQERGDNLVARIGEINDDPTDPMHGVLPHLHAAAQDAYGNAVRYGERPS